MVLILNTASRFIPCLHGALHLGKYQYTVRFSCLWRRFCVPFECEYCVYVWMFFWYQSQNQVACSMNNMQNILNVALFPLYVVSMEFIIVSVIKLGCMCSLCCLNENIFLILRCFNCA